MSIELISTECTNRAHLIVKFLSEAGYHVTQNHELHDALARNQIVLLHASNRLIHIPSDISDIPAFLQTHVLPFLPKPDTDLLRFVRLKENHFPPESQAISNHGLLTVFLKSELKEEFQKKFAKYLYQSTTIEEAVHERMIQKKLTLSTAESCTGGHLAARLTSLPGASTYYLGSVVAYSNELKIHALGIDKETIQKEGAVSEEVVKKMALGILNLTGSDYALAATGIAGPDGGLIKKPVGTVWCAIAKKGSQPRAWLLQAKGSRASIITHSSNELLAELYLEIV